MRGNTASFFQTPVRHLKFPSNPPSELARVNRSPIPHRQHGFHHRFHYTLWLVKVNLVAASSSGYMHTV